MRFRRSLHDAFSMSTVCVAQSVTDVAFAQVRPSRRCGIRGHERMMTCAHREIDSANARLRRIPWYALYSRVCNGAAEVRTADTEVNEARSCAVLTPMSRGSSSR